MVVQVSPTDALDWRVHETLQNKVFGDVTDGHFFEAWRSCLDHLQDLLLVFREIGIYPVYQLVVYNSNRPYIGLHAVGLLLENFWCHCKTCPKNCVGDTCFI